MGITRRREKRVDKETILWAVLAIPIKCKWLLGFTAFPLSSTLVCFCHAGQDGRMERRRRIHTDWWMEIITRASKTNPLPAPQLLEIVQRD